MKIVIFGLTISSSWGNGHATLWRGLVKSLVRLGHHVVFYERDVPYYASMRDLHEIDGGRLVLYPDWADIRHQAREDITDADVAIVTSYCPDSIVAGHLVLSQTRVLRVFYDLDAPVTLARLAAGQSVDYIDEENFKDYDLVLTFSGGRTSEEFRRRLGARNVAPLYGHADSDVHHPSSPLTAYRADLSYLGTYSEDRQQALATLFVQAARQRSDDRFLIAGAQYPQDFPWAPNIYFLRHLDPSQHSAFFSSSRLTLNVTRQAMVDVGWCPSGRLFEAAACGVPLISDSWDGLHDFFAADEIIVASSTDDVTHALAMSDEHLAAMARRARDRVLEQHSSMQRATEMIDVFEAAVAPHDREPVVEV
jgi:spore maturation protein CgeB